MVDDDILFPGDITLDDLDGDGDLDVVLAGLGTDQMIWYENKLKSEGEKECQVLSISPASISTGLGILPRFRNITITLSGADIPEISRDDVNFDAEKGVKILNISAGGDSVEMLVMFWGAAKGTYNVNVGSCGSIPFIVE